MSKKRILAVEDEGITAMHLHEMLERLGYEVIDVVASGEEAVRKAAEEQPDLVLMDIILRGDMDGIEAADEIRHRYGIPVVYVTAHAGEDFLERAKLTEPFGYVIKPFYDNELHSSIVMALYKHEMENRLRESHEQVHRALTGVIDTIAALVKLRDPFIKEHQERVAALAAVIAREMGLPEERIEGIRLAATIHDLGLIGMPFEVLNRRDDLSEAELALYRSHPEVGYEVLKDIDFPWPVAGVVLQHHEKLDGSGYPNGLKGEAIIPEARIVCLADTVEELLARHPEGAPPSIDDALATISQGKDTLYDPEAVAACRRLFREKRFAWMQ